MVIANTQIMPPHSQIAQQQQQAAPAQPMTAQPTSVTATQQQQQATQPSSPRQHISPNAQTVIEVVVSQMTSPSANCCADQIFNGSVVD